MWSCVLIILIRDDFCIYLCKQLELRALLRFTFKSVALNGMQLAVQRIRSVWPADCGSHHLWHVTIFAVSLSCRLKREGLVGIPFIMWSAVHHSFASASAASVSSFIEKFYATAIPSHRYFPCHMFIYSHCHWIMRSFIWALNHSVSFQSHCRSIPCRIPRFLILFCNFLINHIFH
jgi:hypothetical protein